jgi:hypothetical protein
MDNVPTRSWSTARSTIKSCAQEKAGRPHHSAKASRREVTRNTCVCYSNKWQIFQLTCNTFSTFNERSQLPLQASHGHQRKTDDHLQHVGPHADGHFAKFLVVAKNSVLVKVQLSRCITLEHAPKLVVFHSTGPAASRSEPESQLEFVTN